MDGLAEAIVGEAGRDPGGAAAARARRSARSTRRASAATTSSRASMEGRPGFVIAGWCGSADCEAQIKAETQATLRNIPFGGADVTGHVREVREAVARGGVVRQGVLEKPSWTTGAASRAGRARLRARGARLPGRRSTSRSSSTIATTVLLNPLADRRRGTGARVVLHNLARPVVNLSYAVDRVALGVQLIRLSRHQRRPSHRRRRPVLRLVHAGAWGGVRPGSDRGQTRVGVASDPGLTPGLSGRRFSRRRSSRCTP